MGRTAKPWYEARGDRWLVYRNGVRVELAKGKGAKKEATKAFHVLMTAEKSAARGLTLRALADCFLDAAERDCRPLTYEFYKRHLGKFWRHAGELLASDIRPYHVTEWLAKHKWNPTTQHGAVTAIKRLFRWGKKQGYLDGNPLEDLEKPTPLARSEIMTPEQVETILATVKDQAFRDLLIFMRETGCRPSEAMAVEAWQVDCEAKLIVMKRAKTSRKKGDRIIHLSPRAVELCKELMERWPEGKILRNTRGTAWNRFATKSRFKRLRDKLGYGPEATLESFRHEFATDGLEVGESTAVMAELMGHTSTAMIDRHYSQLHKRRPHLSAAVARVRPAKPDGEMASRPDALESPLAETEAEATSPPEHSPS